MAELILALDVPTKQAAHALVDDLKGKLAWCKVGLELFTSAGPSIISELKDLGFKIFLDLKFYDIPNTVAKAVSSACELGVDLLTIHCQGGLKMLTAAQESIEKYKANHKTAPNLLGVTVLTSFADGQMPGISQPIANLAYDLAGLAAKANLYGLVCSPNEVAKLKASYPMLHYLCPGIRPKGADIGDQNRISTPKEAILAGADFLVVGRPITANKNPRQALEAILTEMEEALQK